LRHELLLCAGVVLVDVEEVVDSLAVLLVELRAEPSEHLFQLSDVHIFVVVNIATSEEFFGCDLAIFHDLEQFKHSSVLEGTVVVRTFRIVVFFTRLPVCFNSIVKFLKRDISFHIFVQNEDESRLLSSAHF